jgi:hypothetical protein
LQGTEGALSYSIGTDPVNGVGKNTLVIGWRVPQFGIKEDNSFFIKVSLKTKSVCCGKTVYPGHRNVLELRYMYIGCGGGAKEQFGGNRLHPCEKQMKYTGHVTPLRKLIQELERPCLN